MRVVVFANDSCFSYLLGRELFRNCGRNVALVVISEKTSGSAKNIYKVFRKSSGAYFTYRTFVQLISALCHRLCGRSVRAEARRRGIPVVYTERVAPSIREVAELAPFDIGVALNFDQILKRDTLGMCRHGVLNIHASKLPQDVGISPALWAFARGAKSIWCTLYWMDEGLDSGPVVEQFETAIDPKDGALGMYARICYEAGQRLSELLAKKDGDLPAGVPQVRDGGENKWSWPDREFDRALRQSRRKLIKARDLRRLYHYLFPA